MVHMVLILEISPFIFSSKTINLSEKSCILIDTLRLIVISKWNISENSRINGLLVQCQINVKNNVSNIQGSCHCHKSYHFKRSKRFNLTLHTLIQ